MKEYPTTPENIKRLCHLIGSQSAAARAIGVNVRTMQRWVAGDRKPRQADVMALELVVLHMSS